MRAPSILAQCLPGLLLPHDRTSHAGVTIVPEKDLHLSSPAVKIILSKAAQPYKYVAENVDFYGINIYKGSSISLNVAADVDIKCVDWDTSLHLPLWVPHTRKAVIEKSLDEWTKLLEDYGVDISSLALILRKPLRPLWISQNTLIWLNEVPEYDSWNFTPIILVSTSSTDGHVQHNITSEFSWHYIPGAGDDEESWARGLTTNLFWQNAYDLIDFGFGLCNQKVADIVEKERVYLARRGDYSP